MLDVPDIRDYQRINAEIIQLLDQGIDRIRLIGVENQRLLLAGLSGRWSAIIELEGNAGPELAAGLNAPGLRVICHGSAADGAGSGLIAGQLLILGDAGACTGVSQRGGCIAVAGEAGERSGLNQTGGTLVLLGRVRALAGERQAGGTLIIKDRLLDPLAGRGRRGGQLFQFTDPADSLRPFLPWLGPDFLVAQTSS